MSRNIPLFRIIRIVVCILLIAFIVSLFIGDKPSEAAFDTVKSAVLNSSELTNVQEGSPRILTKLYGLSSEDYDEMFLYYPDSNMGVNELLLIKVEDPDKKERVLNAIQERLDKQLKSFDGYGVEQTKLLQDSIVDDRINYILFVVNGNAAKIASAFEESL